MAVIRASHNGLFVTIGNAVKSALRVSSETLQRSAARPSEDVYLHERVVASIVARHPSKAALDMQALLIASRDRLLPLTVGTAEAARKNGG
jgi:GntR family galactonate operon transcriptional repressor